MFNITKEERGLIHISTGIEMICKIPSMMNKAETAENRTALVECWAVNMRLMIEFFEIGGGANMSKDFSYRLYGYERISDRANDKELIRLKDMISKFVVHFGLARIDETNSKYNDFNVLKIKDYSLLILPEIESFISHIDKTYSQEYEKIRRFIEESFISIK